MLICEIFKSIQGEGKFSGFPCSFIRLSDCNLNCTYCDTKFAKREFISLTNIEILEIVQRFNTRFVQVTGGEPLIQEEVFELMDLLTLHKYYVLLETNGSKNISSVPKNIHIALDIKTPGSGMESFNLWKNLEFLKPTDEIKFVITGKRDFNWVLRIIDKYKLNKFENLLISPVPGKVSYRDAAEWILDLKLSLRLNLQIHKIIWKDERER